MWRVSAHLQPQTPAGSSSVPSYSVVLTWDGHGWIPTAPVESGPHNLGTQGQALQLIPTSALPMAGTRVSLS